MGSKQILIFDPFNSSEASEIQAILTSEVNCHPRIIQPAENGLPPDVDKPDLIVAIFQYQGCNDNIDLYHRFFKQLPAVPTLGIVKGSPSVGYCQILRQFVWNFICAPLRKQDILLNLFRFLYPAERDAPIDSQPLSTVKQKLGFDILKGCSAGLNRVKEKICRVAPFDVNVLVRGQTGTGKELTAKLIHFLSPRSQEPFVAINCGAIPKDLFENELFGHKKGAYTHAEDSQTGLIAAADKGTLFMDEVESLPLATQVKLLRFLETKQYRPLGQAKLLSADIRIIAAAKDDLAELVREKKFREDLFYRLNVTQILLPPLCDRREDIPLLADHFVQRYANLFHKPIRGITPAAICKLVHNRWPGNVRELENVIQEAVVVNLTGWIEAEDLELDKLQQADGISVESFKSAKQKAVEDFERCYLRNALAISRGNISQAAKFAQKDRRAFCRLLKKHGIEAGEFRG